jgi:hypothetical protein
VTVNDNTNINRAGGQIFEKRDKAIGDWEIRDMGIIRKTGCRTLSEVLSYNIPG